MAIKIRSDWNRFRAIGIDWELEGAAGNCGLAGGISIGIDLERLGAIGIDWELDGTAGELQASGRDFGGE